MGSPKIRTAVIERLTKNAGKPVSATDIMNGTGYTLPQVQAIMRSLIKEGMPITVLDKGQIWRYDPEPEEDPESSPKKRTATDMVFEGIGTAKGGTLIVRDIETLKLYILTDIELR